MLSPLYVQHNLFRHSLYTQCFQTSQFPFLLVKMINHCEFRIIFWGMEHQLQENTLGITIFIVVFIKFLLNLDISSTHSKPPTGNFCDIADPCKLLTSQYIRFYNSLLFFIIFHIFVISFCILMNSMVYSTSDTFLYP